MEDGVKFSQRVGNTVEKEEIAPNEQFLLFPLCFQRTCTRKNTGLLVKSYESCNEKYEGYLCRRELFSERAILKFSLF